MVEEGVSCGAQPCAGPPVRAATARTRRSLITPHPHPLAPPTRGVWFGDVVRLQGHDEVGEQGVDGRGVHQRVHRVTRVQSVGQRAKQREEAAVAFGGGHLLQRRRRLGRKRLLRGVRSGLGTVGQRPALHWLRLGRCGPARLLPAPLPPSPTAVPTCFSPWDCRISSSFTDQSSASSDASGPSPSPSLPASPPSSPMPRSMLRSAGGAGTAAVGGARGTVPRTGGQQACSSVDAWQHAQTAVHTQLAHRMPLAHPLPAAPAPAQPASCAPCPPCPPGS